jgi:two-component system, NtrC family, nitrogen regulation sensor histidine kinase NtrY
MVIPGLRRLATGVFPVTALFVMLLISLYLMSAATQNSQEFGRLFFGLLLINVLGLITLVTLIAINLIRLVRQYHSQVTGSRLTVRLVVMFVLLAVAPVSVVYYFSVEFIQRGIDSWFDVRLEKALNDALELSRTSLDSRKLDLLKQAERVSRELAMVPDEQAASALNDLRNHSNAFELTLFTENGHIIASSSADPSLIVPNLPGEAVLSQLKQGLNYVGIDPVRDNILYIRAVVKIPEANSLVETRLLQSLYPVSDRINILADSVQSSYDRYNELTVLRDPLKFSFTLTLSLVLLLSLLMAVLAAFFSARRFVAPIRVLAIGTRAVSAGDYGKRLPLHSNDELGYLVQSFNDMTQKIAQARDDAYRSQQQAEGERAYLRAVLGRLSSGVLTLDKRCIVRTANVAARQILGVDLKGCIGNPLEHISQNYPYLTHFVESIMHYLSGGRQEWREEIVIFGVSGRQVLICGGATLPGASGRSAGHVIVFDDVTALVQAQRDAAWGEVARRLAHEIKNPLTPIQLSAERMRHKYLGMMDAKDAEILDRATHTIVEQVEVLKEMVKAFSEYARSPHLKLLPLDLNMVISEVLDLYRGDETAIEFDLHLASDLPRIEADSGRLRQLLHNLIKNAIEVSDHKDICRISLLTQNITDAGLDMIELRVEDNGPGIPDDILNHLFEPYVTTKTKGTGLGLAIVKKIVEEHGGVVWAENIPGNGASITVRLPVAITMKQSGASGDSPTKKNGVTVGQTTAGKDASKRRREA